MGCKVCVTGGSGYIASWLIHKLLAKGYTVHATLRNLEDKAKVGLLKSFPNAETNLVLFQADIYRPEEFDPAISGCEFVFHVAIPMLYESTKDQLENFTESVVACVRSIAESCIRSGTVKRLVFTGSVVTLSPLNEDGVGYKSLVLDESCSTPLNLPVSHFNDFILAYTKAKVLSEKEALRYNDMEGSNLEVVSIACAQVAGETVLPYVPLAVDVTISQLKGDPQLYLGLKFLHELLGTIPIIHVDDACEAHIFCTEKPHMRGRFVCASTGTTPGEIAACVLEHHPDITISEEFMGEPERVGTTRIDNSRLKEMGFEYKYDLKRIIDDSVQCGRRLGAL